MTRSLQLVPGEFHPPVWANEAEMKAVEAHNLQVWSDQVEFELDDPLDDPFFDELEWEA